VQRARQLHRWTEKLCAVHTHKIINEDASMRYRELKVCLPSILCLVAAQHVWGDTMRCGDKLIEVGDSMAGVQATCGTPADVQRSTAVSATTTGVGDGTRSITGAEVPVETWTYNLGPNQLMVSVRFMNGKVVAIDTLHEYGH
jgi:hypothetical protein